MNQDIYNKIFKYYTIQLEDENEAIEYYYYAQLDTLTQNDWNDFEETITNNKNIIR